MKIKKIGEKDGVTKILIKEADTAIVNAIRRTIMNNVPILAVSDITIYQNTSVFFDEFLASRLGSLPIKTDKTYKKGDKIKLTLEKEGPGIVYSSDIKSADPAAVVAEKNIPIIKLGEKQKIKLEMEAEMNTGKEHAKWQPAIVSYSQLPIIEAKTTSLKKIETAFKNAVIENKAGKLVLDPYECDPQRALDEAGDGKISFDKNSFILYVESHGGLKTKQILEEAINVLIEKNNELKEALKKAK